MWAERKHIRKQSDVQRTDSRGLIQIKYVARLCEKNEKKRREKRENTVFKKNK